MTHGRLGRAMREQDRARPRRAAAAAAPSADCRARRRNRPRAAASMPGARSPPTASSRSDSEIAQKSCPSGAPTRAAAACIALIPGRDDDLDRRPVAARARGRSARRPARRGRRCRHRPTRPAPPSAPAAARSRASRARSASAPIALSWRRLAGDRAAEQIEIEPVADDIARRRRAAALASGVRQAGSPGPMPIDREPAARRGRSPPRRSARGARATAQVARRDWRRATTSAPSGPAAASAAPSATPQQPVARNAASERTRQPRRSRRAGARPGKTAPARRAPRPAHGSPARPILSSTETTAATAPRREPGLGQAVARQRGDLLGRAAALAADAERQHRRMKDQRVARRRARRGR